MKALASIIINRYGLRRDIMRNLLISGTIVILLSAWPAAAQQPQNIPERGSTMDRVERDLGSPAEKVPAVGDPPISRWRYADFTVYFEHDRVLHTVSYRRP
jgi:hypothetical protein